MVQGHGIHLEGEPTTEKKKSETSIEMYSRLAVYEWCKKEADRTERLRPHEKGEKPSDRGYHSKYLGS